MSRYCYQTSQSAMSIQTLVLWGVQQQTGDIKLRFPTLCSSVERRSLFKNNELFCSQLLRDGGDAQIFAAVALFLNEKLRRYAYTSIVLLRTYGLYQLLNNLTKLGTADFLSKNVQNVNRL